MRVLRFIRKTLTIPLSLRARLYKVKSGAILKLLRKVFNGKYPNITLQTKLINHGRFSYLIVSDACRYDYFEEFIYGFLDGVLYPVLSPANETASWLRRTWYRRKYSEIIYFSANPFVNSRKCYRGFCGYKKFSKVVDLWKIAWDEKLLTIPPWNVNKYVRIWLKLNRRYMRTHRFVIHYLQPHYPYIPLNPSITRKAYTLAKELDTSSEEAFLLMLCSYIRDKNRMWDLIRRLYRENLKIALKYIADLVPELEGPVIITSDHGELLGEYQLFDHPNVALPVIRIVPWFIVK